MSSIKSLATIAVLTAIGVVLYIKINNMPEPTPPKDFSGTWGSPPEIDMHGGVDTGAMTPTEPQMLSPSPGGLAPPYHAGGPTDSAPPFAGAAGSPSPPLPAPSGPPPLDDIPPGPGAATQYPYPSTGDAAATSAYAPPADALAASSPPNDPFMRSQPGGTPAPVQIQPEQSAPPSDYRSAAPPTDYRTAAPHQHAAGHAAPPTNGVAPESFDTVWERAQGMLVEGKLAEAHLLLSEWYGEPSLTAPQQDQLMHLLSQLAGTVIYSSDHFLEPAYIVQPGGEELADIASKHNVPKELLAKINGISTEGRLMPGRELKVVRGPFSAIVNTQKKQMVLMLAGRYAGKFDVGVGTDGGSVDGQFEVKNKYTNPTYWGANQTVEADDPNNPLGEHWIGLAPPGEETGGNPLGIHGSGSAYAQDPRGYIRLSPRDAADAFDILSVGSTIVIRR